MDPQKPVLCKSSRCSVYARFDKDNYRKNSGRIWLFKLQVQKSTGKVLPSVFWDGQAIAFLNKGGTITHQRDEPLHVEIIYLENAEEA